MFKKIRTASISKDKKRLLSNFLSLSALQIFTYALPLLTLPYLVRVLGVEKYGLVMFAQSLILFFNILVDYGFNLSATREISIHRDNKDKITEIFSSVMIIKFLILIFSIAILALIVFSFEIFYINKELYFITYLIVVGHALLPIWYFQGLEEMKYITIVNILSRVVFTAAIFLFINKEDDYILVPLLNGFGVILGSIYALYLIKKSFKQEFNFQSIKTLKIYFKDSTDFFLSRVSVSIYTSANAFVLGLFTNNTMVGYYSIAEKLYQAIQGLYGPITQALYPYVAKEKNVPLFKKIFYSVIALNIIGVMILFGFGEFIFSILFTQKIGSESISIFYVFLFANLVAVPSVLLGYPFLGALGFTGFTNKSVMLSSAYHIFGLLIVIAFFEVSIYSVSYLFVTTAMIELLIRVYGVIKYQLWNLN